MGYYVIAIGGTGNKIMESIVYGACADAFYLTGESDKPAPIPMIRLLAVDVDAACGNTTRAKQAGEHYERVRETFRANDAPRRGFHTELRIDRWSMNLSKRAASVDHMVQNHKREQLLARMLFDRSEASLEYSEGFRGHPDLGVLFFADLLAGLEDAAVSGQPDELYRLITEMQAELDRGESVKVALVGSIFGGTGASGIPAISQYLRERFRSRSQRFELASVLMLPYYKVPASPKNEELEIVVKSSEFLDKARTALQYYGMEGMIRSGEDDPGGVYDAVYLLGLPPEDCVTTRIYSTGSQSQENDAHMLEWLAMRCVARFFRTGFRGAESHHMDCYYYQLHSRTFSWESFDEEEDGYRAGFGGLLKAAAVFFAECYPCLRAGVTDKLRGRRNLVNYYAAYFHGLRRLAAPQRLRLEKGLDALYHCLAFYSNWVFQLVQSLPPTLRETRETEEAAREAAECYRLLLDIHARLSMEPPEEAREQAFSDRSREAWEAEYQETLRRYRELAKKASVGTRLEMLKNAQLEQREKLRLQEAAIVSLRERLQGWREGTDPLADPRLLPLEEERLSAMRRLAEGIEGKLRRIAGDMEAMIRASAVSAPAAPEESEPLPENGLFDPELLTALHELLALYGGPSEARDAGRMEALCETLQRGIARLVVRRVPDRADMPRVIAGVAGGSLRSRDPDAMLAGFWAALLGAVLEEAVP